MDLTPPRPAAAGGGGKRLLLEDDESSSAAAASDLRQPRVLVMGVAEGHPDSPSVITQRPDILKIGLAKAAPRAFAMAGVKPADIQVAEIYDCFTYVVLRQLEEIGFCAQGEGGAFVESGVLRLGGKLPTNTDGGGLSSSHPGQRGIFLLI